MKAPASPASDRWADAARSIAPLLNERTCIVMIGQQAEHAARVAIALGQTHVRTRRVAIVDAIGELEPLQRLLPRDAGPHGVIDHFIHGVSLRKIAHAVNREGTLFVVPSGAGPFQYETLLRRERWRRLTMAFRNEGALLCILLPAGAEGLVAFVEDTDGVVLVGDVAYAEPRHVIAKAQVRGARGADATVSRRPSAERLTIARTWIRQARSKRIVLLSMGAALIVAGALFALDAGDQEGRGRRDEPARGSAPPVQTAAMLSANEGDSASAAVYSVDVVMFNSLSAADRHLKEHLGALPAATFSPVRLGTDSARWYRLLVGAWTEEREADSALMALRSDGVLQLGLGSVRRTPFAVRIADSLSPTVAMARAMELRARGLPAYVLRRDEDHASVYAGAFETPSQAAPLLDMFKREGIDATVAYRLGRGI